MATINHQYEAPKLPGGWTADEKRFYNGVIDVFDDIYRRWGRLGEKDLSVKLRTLISDKADGETVTSLTTRIEQTESEIALKASSETVNALGERVSTAETSITQNATAISSKASQSDVNALGERVTTAESEIRQTPDKITAAVGALAIGGTNLIRGTRKMTAANWYGMTGTGKALVALDNDFAGEKIERSGLTSAAYTSCYARTDNVITAGRAYVLTADSYIDPSGTALDGNASLTLVFYSAAGANLQSTAVRLNSDSPTGAWQRLEVKATAPDNAAYAQITMMLSKNGNVTFARLKFEEGNKATAWSPAPEDTDDSVNGLKSELNLVPGQISAAVSAVQVGGTNLVTLGNQSLVNAGGRAAEYIGKDWYRESEHQTTISPYSGVCWLQCPGIDIAAGRKYTLSYYAWIQPGATAGEVKFRPNLFGGTSDTDKYLTDFIPFVIGTPTKYAVTFDTTGWATGTYTLRFVMMTGQTHEVYFTDVKLEKGTKATAWSPNPNEVRIGSSILMDVNHTEIRTPYLDIDVSGTEGDMHIDENGISGGTGTFKTLNCPDVVKSTGSANYSGGLQEAFDALNGRFLTGDVTISLSADQYGTFMLKGVYGVNASINIVGNGHSINGALAVYNCKLTNVGIGGVTINGNGSSTPLVLMDAGYVSVIGATVNGGGAGTAVDANYGTRLMMYDNGLYNASNLIRLGHCTEGSLVQLRGGSCTNYLRADGARWTMSGTRPDGTYAQENTCLHAPENPDSLTIDYGTSQPPVTPVTTTSYTANVTGTYYPSGHWMSSNQMLQGRYDSTRYYGCMWFGASALSGKTIKSATLTIKRIAGAGKSSAVNVTLYTSPVTGKSGNPTTGAVSLGTLGKAANGESVTVTLPTSAIDVIATGGALMLDPGDTVNASGKRYSSNYARFEGTDASAPVLTVTYQ